MKNRYGGLPWTHSGPVTRSMTEVMRDCACSQPTFWVALCGFERDIEDMFHIKNMQEWDHDKFGPGRYPFAKNLDQVLTFIWREMPMWVNSNQKVVDREHQPLSEFFASKELFFCQGPMCNEIISPEVGEVKCVFCGHINVLENCEQLGVPPNKSKMTKIYPDKFAPILKSLRDWFRDIPSLVKIGLEFGVITYRFGTLLKRQLKIVPRPYFRQEPACYGWLNAGESNRNQMVPGDLRYTKNEPENWYEKEYRTFYSIRNPVFDDQNYLLGSPDMETMLSGDNGWLEGMEK